MRSFPAVLLAALLLVPVPTGQALHDGDPIVQADEPSHAFYASIVDLNETIAQVEAEHGEHPAINEAKQARAKAMQAFMAANHWLTLHHLLQSTVIIERHNAWEANQGASDQEAAYFSDMRDAWERADDQIHRVHERMKAIENEGVDLWMLDHALLAGSILVKGERFHVMWGDAQSAWEDDRRDNEMKNMLVASSYGAMMHANLAENILDRAVENQTEEPVGPVVGTHTLRGITDALDPVLSEGSMSLDRTVPQLISSHMANEVWLAALGGTLAWAEEQANAAVQHGYQADEPPFQPEDVVAYLFELDEDDDTLQDVDEMGVPGASARFSLSEAAGIATVLEQETEDRDEISWTMALQAADGLGALSAAHTSMAILTVAAGESPPDRIIHLPTHSSGALDLDESDLDAETESDEGAFAVPAWGWIVTLVTGLLVALFLLRRRRD